MVCNIHLRFFFFFFFFFFASIQIFSLSSAISKYPCFFQESAEGKVSNDRCSKMIAKTIPENCCALWGALKELFRRSLIDSE